MKAVAFVAMRIIFPQKSIKVQAFVVKQIKFPPKSIKA